MPEVTILLDTTTGAVLVEAPDALPTRLRGLLADRLGPETEVGCARPAAILPPPRSPEGAVEERASLSLRVAGYYHNSLIEGPGRRSCLLVSGCTLACVGCWVSALHA